MNRKDRIDYLVDVFIIWDELVSLKEKYKKKISPTLIPRKELIKNAMMIVFDKKTKKKIYRISRKQIGSILSEMNQIGQIYYPKKGFIDIIGRFISTKVTQKYSFEEVICMEKGLNLIEQYPELNDGRWHKIYITY